MFKQKTAYDMRFSDLSSDVCSSDLSATRPLFHLADLFQAAIDLHVAPGSSPPRPLARQPLRHQHGAERLPVPRHDPKLSPIAILVPPVAAGPKLERTGAQQRLHPPRRPRREVALKGAVAPRFRRVDIGDADLFAPVPEGEIGR